MAEEKLGRVVDNGAGYRTYHRKWTGEDLKDFICLSVHTGLRISDVATFNISRMTEDGDIFLHAKKNNEPVYTWIPEWLQVRLRARAKRLGPCIFGEHTTTDINVITDVWRRKLKAMWQKSGPWKEKPTHHRFRHTFVRILLQKDVPVKTVAELIGDTEQMVYKHYSKWVPERQEQVRMILKEALGDKHKPKLAVLPKTGTRD